MFHQSTRWKLKKEKRRNESKEKKASSSCVWRWFIEQTRPFFWFLFLSLAFSTSIALVFLLFTDILFFSSTGCLLARSFLGISYASRFLFLHTKNISCDWFSCTQCFWTFFCLFLSFRFSPAYSSPSAEGNSVREKSDDFDGFLLFFRLGCVCKGSLRQKYRKVSWTFIVIHSASSLPPFLRFKFRFFFSANFLR